ncbi:MAG: hypothetical protein ACFE9L_03690 [Candidatus Hodarchaeota archaeon]
MDGGLVLVGLTISEDLGLELPLESVVIKTDVNGTIQWEKTFKGTEKEIYIGLSLL